MSIDGFCCKETYKKQKPQVLTYLITWLLYSVQAALIINLQAHLQEQMKSHDHPHSTATPHFFILKLQYNPYPAALRV